jgi:hypothetical protein
VILSTMSAYTVCSDKLPDNRTMLGHPTGLIDNIGERVLIYG